MVTAWLRGRRGCQFLYKADRFICVTDEQKGASGALGKKALELLCGGSLEGQITCNRQRRDRKALRWMGEQRPSLGDENRGHGADGAAGGRGSHEKDKMRSDGRSWHLLRRWACFARQQGAESCRQQPSEVGATAHFPPPDPGCRGKQWLVSGGATRPVSRRHRWGRRHALLRYGWTGQRGDCKAYPHSAQGWLQGLWACAELQGGTLLREQ